MVFDHERTTVTFDGRAVKLGATAFSLLTVLASRPGRVFSRTELARAVWGAGYLSPKTVAMQVLRLRQALEADPLRPRLIVTVRGEGYRLGR